MYDMKSKAAKGKSAAGSGKRGVRDIAKGAAPKGPGKDGKYKAGDMFRSGRIVQPSVAPGKAKPVAKVKKSAAGSGKSASQDINKRSVKALYKNK